MKRTLRRIASLLCVLSLCLTLLPGTAWAEDESPLPEEPAAAECICDILCTEDAIHAECPVCGVEGADLTLCLGAAPEVPTGEPTEPEAPAEEPVDEIPAEEPTEPEIPIEEPEEVPGEEPTEPEAPVEEPVDEESAEAPTEPEIPAEEPPVLNAEAPTIEELSVAGNSATADTNGSLITSLPADTPLAGKAFSLKTSEAVTFVVEDNPTTGTMYVAAADSTSVTLALALGGSVDGYSISMTTSDGVNWSGSFSSSFDMTMGALATALSSAGATLEAGSMISTSTSTPSNAYVLYCNQDAVNAQLIVCYADIDTYEVDYVVTYDEDATETAYSWTVPTGAAMTEPDMDLYDNQTLDGWYYDAALTQAVTFGVPVTADQTLYAAVTTTAAGSFAAAFERGDAVLPISTPEDWESFISLASQVGPDQRVELETNIDCGGATYTSLTFAGDFDGGGNTISNATFTAVDGNAGMFKTIGPDQKVCNLVLSNVAASYAGTYAGVLAGAISGTEGHNALIQNVQVRGGSASGRSAGGIAGYIFFADVKYCSSTGTEISGMANGGGIGGISYGQIYDCYSTCAPTALPFLGTSGGIAGKNLEGGTVNHCWCTENKAVGQTTSATESSNFEGVNGNTMITEFTSRGFTPPYWQPAPGTGTTFTGAVEYNFSANA